MAIGVFDSGLGGLTVVGELRKRYPRERILYYGDTLRVPYGERRPEELILLADRITRYLIREGASLVVDACNTTSALALDYLLEKYGEQAEIVGVVGPASRAAASLARRSVGILATEATTRSGAYQRMILSAREGIQVMGMPCSRLVPFVESGDLDSYMVREAVEAYVEPLLEQGADTLVLGCTHYPFLRPLIDGVTQKRVAVVDPAREAVRDIRFYVPGDTRESVCTVSGDPDSFRDLVDRLLPQHGFARFGAHDVMEENEDEDGQDGPCAAAGIL